ncbi:UNVERIFIED_CONTAM: hypothetical protein Scaly_1641400 [Sesamum calycinum]|uniref:Retrotransposon gag domain-containing protein n=2 Tax=Sesamum TaxID=4181 RepID=A0AAW2PBZ0_9LAMI
MKCSKVELLKFDGDDLRGWVFKCEQFFEVDDTPSGAKAKLAAVHLEGRALQWHQVYMKSRLTREVPNWEEYVRALYDRFGTQLYDDPMAELMNLKQVGTVQDYLDKFDELLNRVDLLEAYVVSCLLAGLRSDIFVQELDEKRAKGLCFVCDEEYTIGHQYSGRKQLYFMVVFEDEEEELVAQGSDESKTVCAIDNGDVDAAHDYYVSMDAMTG